MNNLIIFYLLLAIILWGLGAFFDKLTLKYTDAHSAFFIRLLLMIIVFIPAVLWRFKITRYLEFTASKAAVIYVALSAVVTMGGMFFYLKALQGEEASRIIPLSSTYPVITFILAVALLGENFTWLKALGTVLVSAGVYCISR